jgi:L-ascorbate metabolism protein UlaG (beta-lactamase superfamily)
MGILVTMDAKEGLEMFNIINPKKAIPMQYNDSTMYSSPEDFQHKIKEAEFEDRIHYLCIMERHVLLK